MAGTTDAADSTGFMSLGVKLTPFAIVARPPLLPTGAVGGRSRMIGPDLCPAGH